MTQLTEIRRVAGNYGKVLLGEILSAVTSFAATIVLANGLGVFAFGTFALAVSLFEVFFSVSDLGMQSWSIREMARYPDRRSQVMTSVIAAKSMISLCVFVSFCSFTIIVYGADLFYDVFVYFAFGLAVDAFTIVFYSVFQSIEQMNYLVGARGLSTFTFLGGAILTTALGFGLPGAAISYMLSRFVPFVASLFSLVHLRIFPSRARAMTVSTVVRHSTPFAALVVLTTLVPRFGVILISLLFPQSPEFVGWFVAALRLVLISYIVSTSLIVAVYPLLSRFHATETGAFEYGVAKATKFLLVLGTLISLVFVFLSSSIIEILYASEYLPSVLLLQILGLSVAPTFLRMALEWGLNAANAHAMSVRSNVIRFLTVAVFSLSVVTFGTAGAAAALVLGELVGAAFGVHYSRRAGIVDIGKIRRTILQVGLVGLVSGITTLVLLHLLPPMNLLMSLLVKSVVVIAPFGVAAFLLVIDDDDIRALRQALRIREVSEQGSNENDRNP